MKILIEDVSVNLNSQNILKNINLTLNKSCVYGLIGNMGSGKSTLLKVILELISPASGDVKSDIAKSNRSYCSSELSLYKELTVIENIKFWLKIHNAENVNLDNILDEFKMQDIAYKRVSELSSGNKQLVNLVCALINESNLIVLDEPFSSLDHKTISIMKDFIKNKSKNAITIIVSHNIEDIIGLCSHIIVLEDKRVAFSKTIDELNEDEEQIINSIIKESEIDQ